MYVVDNSIAHIMLPNKDMIHVVAGMGYIANTTSAYVVDHAERPRREL